MAFDAVTYALAKKYADKKIDITVESVYKFMGSVETFEELLTKTAKNGEVYNVKEDNMNYAWSEKEKEWDALGVNQDATNTAKGLIKLTDNTFTNTTFKDGVSIITDKEEIDVPEMLSGIVQEIVDYSKGEEKLQNLDTFEGWNLYNIGNTIDYTLVISEDDYMDKSIIYLDGYESIIINSCNQTYVYRMRAWDKEGQPLWEYSLSEYIQQKIDTKNVSKIQFVSDYVLMEDTIINYTLERLKENGIIHTLLPAKVAGEPNWSSQIKYSPIDLQPNKWYTATVSVMSEQARKFQLLIQSDGDFGGDWSILNEEQIFDVESNIEKTFSILFKTPSEVKNSYLFGFMCGYIEGDASNVPATWITVKDFSFKEFEESPIIKIDSVKNYVDNIYSAGRNVQLIKQPNGRILIESNPGEGENSTAEGYKTIATGESSHAEGTCFAGEDELGNPFVSSTASGIASHAEGTSTIASGAGSHSEGGLTKASGNRAHAEGYGGAASGTCSHVEGGYFTNDLDEQGKQIYNIASGYGSHAEGAHTEATAAEAHAEGAFTKASGTASHVEGYGGGKAVDGSRIYNIASGFGSHAEGYSVLASGAYSHVEGGGVYNNYRKNNKFFITTASGDSSHAEGRQTEASGVAAHAEGLATIASGNNSHAEGGGRASSFKDETGEYIYTTASGDSSHAEGIATQAKGGYSHAEAVGTITEGIGSHAEGNQTIATGNYSHAEGVKTVTKGSYSHAQGRETVASAQYSDVIGVFNIEDTSEENLLKIYNTSTGEELPTKKYAHIIGNGTSEESRSNAYTLDWLGNGWFAGDVIIHKDGKEIKVSELGSNVKEENDYDTKYKSYSLVRKQEGVFLGKYNNQYDYYKDDEIYINTEYEDTISEDAFLGELNLINKLGLQESQENQENSFCGSHVYDDNPDAYGKFEAFDLSLTGQYRTQEPTGNEEFLGIDLNSEQDIAAVAIKWYHENNIPHKMIVQISEDAYDWEDVKEFDISAPDIESIYVYKFDAPIQARYIRVLISREDTVAMVISELGIMSANTEYYKFTEDHESIEGDSLEGLIADGIVEKIEKSAMPELATIEYEFEDRFGKKISVGDTVVAGGNIQIERTSNGVIISSNAGEGERSTAEGISTIAQGTYSHAEGAGTKAIGAMAHAEGVSTQAIGEYSHAEGAGGIAKGVQSHVEGVSGTAEGVASHKEGMAIIAKGDGSHAEGGGTNAIGNYSHAEGSGSKATGDCAHAEGGGTNAIGNCSHTEGNGTKAEGLQAHAEGNSAYAEGYSSHAEGSNTYAKGDASHAEGCYAQAYGPYSHAEGLYTRASGHWQHVEGAYNKIDSENKYIHIAGNGSGEANFRNNAYTLDWFGNGWFAGDVTIHGKDSGEIKVSELNKTIKYEVKQDLTDAQKTQARENLGMVILTQAEYDEIAVPDENVLYFIKKEGV